MRLHVSTAIRVATTSALVLVLSTGGASGSHGTHPIVRDVSCPVVVRFSPHGGSEQAVTDTLSHARVRVRAALYGLTSPVIEHALAELARAGVHVALKTDRGQSAGREQTALLNRLQAAGVSVAVSGPRTPIHDKFAVVDSRWVITGSFNWTTSAERRNRENVLVLDCPDLAALFEAEWESIAPSDP
jgi:phosphatidylserine/phosphatidylglycerophosphate/cardiolipin synthase-like enzyme